MKEMSIKFTKKGFEDFCDALNHRMTKIETNVRWLKWIISYLAVIFTGAFIKIMFFTTEAG